jgi:hypothetical protein
MDLTGVPWPAITGLLGVVLTLYYTNRREANRQEHERTSMLREEKRQAYATMARITKRIQATEPHTDTDLAQALSEIELVTDNTNLIDTSGSLVQAMAEARSVLWDLEEANFKRPFRTPRYREAKRRVEEQRAEYLRLAKDELRHKPKPSLLRRLFSGA